MSSTINLRGLGVMVTRPAHQAEPLCQLIEAAGGRPYRFPLLEIHPLDTPRSELQHQLDRLGEFDMAIFISPNAVERALELIQEAGGLPEQLKLATVGRGSANMITHLLGRKPDICAPPPFNSEALLTNSGMQNLSDRNIIIFRGNGGRELLAETLRSRGAKVEYCEVYRRACPQIEPAILTQAWEQGKIELVTITSGEGLRNLVHLAGSVNRHWLFQTPLVLINRRLAAQARELGFNQQLLISNEASDNAMIETIGKWVSQHTTS
ncbi:MAG TPA: uroporphyrinogen-III synthase [Gammaproteobacteria bacterium]|nr:uroporphyrinogen-III synthase [Gammaproteobacteria bacterium]